MMNYYNSLGVGINTGPKRTWRQKTAMLFFLVMFSVLSVQGQVTVAGCTGAGNGSYTTLGAAFSAIVAAQPAAVITVTISGDTSEAAGGATLVAGTWTSLTIAPSGGPWTISGAATAGNPLINFNGSDNVTINGGGNLTISNTTASATSGTSTLKLIGDATSNTFNNVTFLGSSIVPLGTNGGTVWISTGTSTGNDNNSFQSCKFGAAGANLPSKAIYGNGSTTNATIANSNVTINNCELYDYFLAGGCAGVYALTGNTDWNVTNNKIYQTASRAMTSTMSGIYFANSGQGDNVQITGNTIGYASNSGTGTLTLTGTGSFQGIYFVGKTTAVSASNLNNNTISDISHTSGSGTFYGIYNVSGASSNTININGNTVKNINMPAGTGSCYGIHWTSATNISVSNNNVNNITRNGSGAIYGLYSGSSSVNETINGNTVRDLSNTGASSNTIYGIYQATAAGTKLFQNNTVYNLTGNGGMTLYGIYAGYGTTLDMSGNTVYALTNTGGTGGTIYGIGRGTVATTANIYKNKVYGLSSTSTGGVLYGLHIAGGTTTNTYNNIIGGLTMSAVNSAFPLVGIYISGGTTSNVYYNTVRIPNGTSSGALFGSAAIYANTTPTVDLRNNIFVNASTPSGAGIAAAYRRSSTTLTSYASTSNNNMFFGTAVFTDGTNTDATLSAFQTRLADSRDSASKFQNPTFDSTTGSAGTFLHFTAGAINFAGGNGQVIAGYATDFDGDTRDASTPDIGADEFEQGLASVPTITSFSPASLCVVGGQTVNIIGTNLDSVTSVLFNGPSGVTLEGSITAQTATTITVTSPATIVDGVIRVVNSAGSADSASTFTAAPTPTIGVTSGSTICSGASVSLTATGGSTYAWSPATGLSATTGDAVTASPTITTTYTVTGTSAVGCSATNTVTITVNPTPSAITVAKNPTIACLGGVTTLTATGGTVPATGTATAGLGASTTSGSGGSGTNYVSPFTHYFGGYKAQYIYRASELTALGLVEGSNISSLAFDVTTAGTTYTGFTLSLGLTSATVATTTFNTATLTQVYTGNYNVSATGLTNIAFGTGAGSSSTFTWDGSSNIVVNLCWSNNNGGGTAAEVKYDTTSFVAMAYYRVDSTLPAAVCSATSATTLSNRPKMVFGYNYSVPGTFLWAPATDLFTDLAATAAYGSEDITVAYSNGTTPNTYTVTSTLGSCSSTIMVTVTPNALPTIAVSDAVICNGGAGTTLTATGGTTYAWSPATGLSATDVDSPTANPTATTTYTITGTDANGCINTTTATVTVNNPVVITGQPSNVIALSGSSNNFTVTATATGISYQWQVDTGSGFGDISGETNATLTVTATVNASYRCVVSGTSPCTPVISDVATLTISSVSFLTQPQPQTICSDDTATFSVTTDGAVSSYQWQYSTDSGANWFDLSGETTDTLVLGGQTSASTGFLIRCSLNAGAANSNSALLTVYDVVAITSQPTNQSVCAGVDATFTAAATGSGLSYQWQFSTDGGSSWSNVASAGNTASYIVTSPTGTSNNNQYQVIVTGTAPCSPVTSSAATLTVTDVTVVTTASSICNGADTTLTASFVGTPDYTTATWTSTEGSGASTPVSGASALVTPTAAGTYVYTFTTDGTCPFTKTVSVTVNALPTITTATATPTSVCSGDNINLAATSIGISSGSKTIGTQASTSLTGGPYRGGSCTANKVQYLIPASELLSNGVAAGDLTSLTFVTTSTGSALPNFTISMGTTALSAMTTDFVTTGLTQVYSNASYTPVSGNNLHTFSVPYAWDGTSNVIVSVCHDYACSSSGTMSLTSNAYAATSYLTSGASGSNCASTTGGIITTTRPVMIFAGQVSSDITSSYTWSWDSSPAVTAATGTTSVTNTTGAPITQTFTATATSAAGCPASLTTSAVTINSTIPAPTGTDSSQCGTGTPTASVAGTGRSGATFKWYTVSTGGTALAGQSGSTLVAPYTVSATTEFYVSEASADGLCESERTIVTVTVTSPYAFTLSSGTATNCSGSASLTPVTIATNGGYDTYSWSNSATVSGDETLGWTFNPTTTTTYTLTASGGGCSTTATVVVTPTALPIITIAPPAAICVGASSTLTALTTTISAGTSTIGAGATTSATYSNPFYSAWSNTHTQHIVLASELTAMGLKAGNITSVALDVTSAGTLPMIDLSVKIGTTAATTMAAFVSNVGFQTVYTNASLLPTVGVNTLTFSAPFNWDGTSNLVLEFCHGNGSSTATMSRTVKADATAYVSSIKAQVSAATSAATICANTTTNLVTYSVRPQFIFGGQVGSQGVGTLAYTWNDPLTTTGNVLTVSPASTTAYTVSGYDSVTGCTGTATGTVTVYDLPTAPSVTSADQCGTRVPLVSVADTNGYTTPTFKWYADNVTTTALQTSTSTTYTTSVSTTTTFFVSVVSPGGCESPRAEVTTTVVAPATLTVSPAVAICTGGNTTLTASGAVSYTWTPALGLDGTTSESVIASPSATTTYSVTGIDSNGCTTAAATVVVTVNAYPTAVTITQGAASVCENSVMSLTATGGTVGSSGSAVIGTATTLTTANGTEPTAFNNRYKHYWMQMVYTPAELIAAGLSAGSSISAVQFNITTLGDASQVTDLKVRMGTAPAGTLTAFQSTGLTLVKTAATYSYVVGLNTLTYDTNYTWDGTSNVIFDLRSTGVDTTNNAITYYTATAGNTVATAVTSTTSSSDGFPATNPAATLSVKRLNTAFTYSSTVPTTITWSPTDDLYTTVGADTPYTGQNQSVVYTKPSTTRVYTATSSNGACATTSETSTVTPVPQPVFSLNGTTTICNGQTTSLTATGSGYDYVWSPSTGLSATTGSVVDANPTATTTYTVVATDTTTGCESSQTITVTVNQPGAINPIGTTTSQIAVPTGTTTFTVATVSGPIYTYQWQVNDGSGWSNLANDAFYADVTTATLTLLDVQEAWDGYQYQCLVTAASPCATLTPIVATLTVSTTGIETQPASVTLCETTSTSFTVVTNGDEPYGIQWQISTDDGFSYADIADGLDVSTGLTFSGVDTTTLGVSGVTLANSGVKFICVLNFFLPSDFATLTVKQPVVITVDPVDQTVCSTGGTATFSTTATGDDLTYQWQFSTDGGTSWSNYVGTGATTASIAILNPALGTDGYQYHVIVSGNAACSSATSASATLNINNPTITSQPAAATVLAGNTATFTVAASAATGYQWEYSTNGSTGWAAVADATPTGNTYSGATSATLSVVTSDLTAAGAANYYRCVVTDTGCTVTSNGAQMTVVGYCIPAPSSVDGDGITNVTMGDINNETLVEAGNYGNYSAQSTTATQSSTVNFAITYGTGYTYGTKIWIDFNNNGVFTDPAEQVYFGLSTDDDPTTLLGSFNLAADAPLGSHRLRIGGTDNDAGPSTPCYTGAYGTFEDYTINIIAAPACSGAPTAGVASAASASLCAGGSTTLSLVGSTSGVTGISYQWYSSADNVTFAPVSGETTTTLATGALTADAYYYAVVTCANGGLTDNSNTVTITVSDPQITGSTPAAICGTGTAVLAATANAGSTINWYTALTGGTSLYTGASFTTPSIATTTTYYAEAVSGGGSGNASTTYTGSTTNGVNIGSHGIAITTTSPSIKIVSADIPFTGTGTFTVSLKDATNTTVISSVTTGSVTGSGTTAVTVPLNITVPTAGNYLLMITAVSGSVGALGYSTVTYPATALSGAFSVTGGYWYSVGTSNMYLYNLNVSNGCSSTRTAVTATVDPKPTATISYAGSPYCYNAAPVSVTLNGTNAYTGGTFTASPAGLSIDGTTGAIDPSLSTEGTYTITYTTNATTYCTPQTATATVTVNPSVLNAGFTYASATYCTNSATASPTITGFAGTFTASPAGLSINATTGAIAFATSTPGSYTVTNTVSACSSSDVVTFDITVNQAPVITTQPASATVCPSANASFTVAASGTGVTYQWEENTGSGWATIVDAGVYSNATTATLSITGATVGMNAYQYRAIVSDTSGCGTLTSGAATLTISQPATPIISPVGPSVCPGGVQALAVTNALQGNATLGTGTLASGTTSYPNPLSAYYGGAKHQMLYTATELQAQGLGAGSVISSIKFDLSTFAANACTDFTIRMGTTANTALTGFVAGTSTVYGPTTYTPSATGIVSFTLSAPFTWDGTSNLIVETVHNAGNGGNGSGTTNRYTATTGTNTVYYGYKDNVAGGIAGFDAAAITLFGASPNRPNTIFGYNLGTTTWSPTTDLYTNAGATVAYTGGNAATVYTKPTSTTTYTATNTNLNGCTNTATTTVTVLPASTLGSVSQPVTTCSGAPTTFNLTGLVPSSTSTIAYTVNAIAQTPITGVVADASGNGSLVLALAAFTNGQTLVITSITRTDVTPTNCATAITANNSVTISVQALVTYYADADGDGFGDNAVTDVTCLGQPVGYVTNNTDCDDTNINIYQFATFYVDADADGYDAGTASVCSGVAVPTGYSATTSGTDCDDTNIAITVGPEFYADTDGDGFGNASSSLNACTQPSGYVANNTDCDDTNINIYQFATFYVDADGDTYGSTASANVCSGLTTPAGYSTNNLDCDDTNPALNPTNPCSVGSVVNLTLFVEGYYTGSSTMNSVKLNQDYVSPADEVEDLTIELHDAADYSLVDTAIGTLKTDGTLSVTFNTAAAGSYYIAVKGSNLVQTWSAEPQAVGTTPLDYDFSTSASQAYGDNMREVETGVFAFYSGDINQDEGVDNLDTEALLIDIDTSNFGVLTTDLNGDGGVDNLDTDNIFPNIDNSIFSFHP